MFKKLLQLTNKSETFYTTTHTHNGEPYTTFSYRLASYGDFKDNEDLHSIESRGITFENSTGRCVSRPMHKFFNLNENPYTEKLDLNELRVVQPKMDGSLISTVSIGNDVECNWFLKSKNSFTSFQVHLATDYLNSNVAYKTAIDNYLGQYPNRTINFEIVSPDNRIVVLYDKTELVILNIRDNLTGVYYEIPDTLSDYFVGDLTPKDKVQFVNSIYDIDGDSMIEGFVVYMNSGLIFKVKTIKYSSLHRIIDQVKYPKNMLDIILLNGVDDVIGYFHDNMSLIEPLLELQRKVVPYYNHMVATVEKFHSDNTTLSQKEYAILGKELFPSWHSLLMSKRNNKPVNYDDWMRKYYLDVLTSNEIDL